MTRASDTARLLGAGATILDGTTITTADNTTQLTLTSTDADASVGPVMTLKRDSSSPADDDAMGFLKFDGENSASEQISYASINARSADVTDGTEDGKLDVYLMQGGTSLNKLSFNTTETVFNEDSGDVDFRVETDANTHGLFVDAGSDLVSIGQSDLRAKLSIGKAKSGSSAESSNLLSLEPTGTFAIGDTANITFHKGSTTNARISGYYGDDNIAYGELALQCIVVTTSALPSCVISLSIEFIFHVTAILRSF